MGPASRIVLAVAALDCLASGLGAIFFPHQFFALLQLGKPPTDGFLLPVLGWLGIANSLCLVAACLKPGDHGGLTLVPWVGRLLCCGMWLWLLGTDRIAPAHEPLYGLLAHDAFWLIALGTFLVVHFMSRRR